MNKENNRRMRHKKLLIERKRKMWNDLRDDVFRKLGRDYSSQFDIPHDLEELSVLDLIEDLGLAVTDIRKQDLEMLERALKKIEDGTYGTCGRCGGEIDEGRLRVLPYSEHCLRCQGEVESLTGAKKPTL